MIKEEIICPVCKSDSYLSPNIKLYISPCYHRMCEMCIARIFANGQAPCPECGVVLRQMNFLAQTFEDITVEKECRMRKQLGGLAHKTQKDFDSLAHYDDYLEDFEDTILLLLDEKHEKDILAVVGRFAAKYTREKETNTAREADDSASEDESSVHEESQRVVCLADIVFQEKVDIPPLIYIPSCFHFLRGEGRDEYVRTVVRQCLLTDRYFGTRNNYGKPQGSAQNEKPPQN